jgi:hypothetical protein
LRRVPPSWRSPLGSTAQSKHLLWNHLFEKQRRLQKLSSDF